MNISLLLDDQPNIVGLMPVLQKTLNTFCDVLPKNDPWVQSKFTATVQQLQDALTTYPEFSDPARSAFINRVALYVLWRSLVQQYVGPSLGVSTEFQNLCKRCPPLGITISNHGKVIPFISQYTCKHYLCPSCRMRKVLATWNKFKETIAFTPDIPINLLHFTVTRKFIFTGLGTGDFKVDILQELLKRFKALPWTYGGMWTIGLTSVGPELSLVAKCGAVCPYLSEQKLTHLHNYTTNINHMCALAGQDIHAELNIEPCNYEAGAIERLFQKTLDTAIWPASFMLDCTSPVSTLFAIHLETAFRGKKTIGAFGPCSTVRKRLKRDQ